MIVLGSVRSAYDFVLAWRWFFRLCRTASDLLLITLFGVLFFVSKEFSDSVQQFDVNIN